MTATKESGEAVSEENVAENMTFHEKVMGKSPRLQSRMFDNDRLITTATLSALPITTTGKVSQKGSSEN